MVNPFVATLRLIAFLGWTLVLLPPYLAVLAASGFHAARFTRFYFRRVARICGFHVVVHGTPAGLVRPVMFVSNHSSYLDIVILGSLLPACFVAKTEVAGWPGFGFLARIARTVFVARRRGGSARERDLLRRRLDGGDSLILFPEGTSNDGNRVLPFKSSLFAVVEAPLADSSLPVVQPVSVAYTRLDGMPMGRAFRSFYAWYGDMTLAGHLFEALGLGEATVEVTFHAPVTLADFGDRKALANHCHDVVANGVVRALCGRPLPPALPHPAAAVAEA
ncbi:1-acyl-sn-glycerol-3-phosphate acyltransferase [Magnetospirillum sp. UT-4]|uniref:lysophospholipid acyltransferase family protein n=1 Tax=Magnetospirillum sp. UT-4 TaxID=2681467 RepID=UPI00137F6DF3|nr:lysophospholipid acyltransferase family protein [Magnetospirillum sp. UT-4]CAA7624505.1 1-acyl-sn-glycerol-3-phosphate acyltransferase [Magnetospirillum sp. UT-4]